MRPSPVDDQVLDRIGELVGAHTGMSFRGERRRSLARAAASAIEGGSPEVYLDALSSGGDALDRLVEAVSVFETYFFREPGQLEFVRRSIVPAVVSGADPTRELRLWSAGCATGEEPYTLAMIVNELGLSRRASIVATDLSERALDEARRASYGRWSVRATPASMLDRYFTARGTRYDLVPEIRDMVSFRRGNLLRASSPAGDRAQDFDLILCRNVLIYFAADAARRVAESLAERLSPRGWLVLGASDPLYDDLPGVRAVATGAGAVYTRDGRSAARIAPEPARTAPTDAGGDVGHPGPGSPGAPTPWDSTPTTDRPDSAGTGREARVAEPLEPGWTVAGAYVQPPGAPVAPEGETAALAVAECEGGRMAAAVARLRAADGRSPTPWVIAGRTLADRGRVEWAVRLLAAGLERHADSVDLRVVYALALAERGRTGEAIDAARAALFLDRSSIVGHVTLGTLLGRAGHPSRALRHYRHAGRLLRAREPSEVLLPYGESAGQLLDRVAAQLRVLETRGVS